MKHDDIQQELVKGLKDTDINLPLHRKTLRKHLLTIRGRRLQYPPCFLIALKRKLLASRSPAVPERPSGFSVTVTGMLIKRLISTANSPTPWILASTDKRKQKQERRYI